jgi:hypothetical protein
MEEKIWQQEYDTTLVDLPDGRMLALVTNTTVEEDDERWYMDIDWLWWAENVRHLTIIDIIDQPIDGVMGMWIVRSHVQSPEEPS